MKKVLCYVGTSLTVLMIGLIMYTSHSAQAESLFHTNGVPTQALKNVFNTLGMSISTLQQANELAQKNLLRKGERWSPQQETMLQKKMNDHKKEIIASLHELGMFSAATPQKKEYTYALLMGSLKDGVGYRMDYLTELCQAGYGFKYIVLLGGERPLRDIEKENLPSDVSTESQMMVHLYGNNQILKDKKALLVNAPMVKKDDGTINRPTTDDTVEHFALIAPENGPCLVISHGYYTPRQTKATQRILDQSRFPTDGSGKKINQDSEKLDIVMLLDEFARDLNEEYKKQVNKTAA